MCLFQQIGYCLSYWTSKGVKQAECDTDIMYKTIVDFFWCQRWHKYKTSITFSAEGNTKTSWANILCNNT